MHGGESEGGWGAIRKLHASTQGSEEGDEVKRALNYTSNIFLGSIIYSASFWPLSCFLIHTNSRSRNNEVIKRRGVCGTTNARDTL